MESLSKKYDWREDYKRVIIKEMDLAWDRLNQLWYVVEYKIDIRLEDYYALIHQATFNVLHSRVFMNNADEIFNDVQKSLERLWKMLSCSMLYCSWVINRQRGRTLDSIKNIKELYSK